MPLAILVVAGGLGWWSTHTARCRQSEVDDFVSAICDDAFNGRNPADRLAATDQLLRERLASRLREVAEGVDGAPQRVSIEVVEGDTFTAPASSAQATHTATLHADGTVVLGLRILHPGEPDEIAIIGFSSPPPR